MHRYHTRLVHHPRREWGKGSPRGWTWVGVSLSGSNNQPTGGVERDPLRGWRWVVVSLG